MSTINDAVRWNPWHGCIKKSEGCLNCWMYQMDESKGIDSSIIKRSITQFDYPVQKDRSGYFKLPMNQYVFTCFTSDFFIEQADGWRDECWEIMKCRSDCKFQLLTKRPERVLKCLPKDWFDYGDTGYPNVIFAVSCENQRVADERLPILLDLPFKEKLIFCSPMIGEINMSKYLCDKISAVNVGGENYRGARPLKEEWVKSLYEQCVEANVSFQFWDIGSNFISNGKCYRIKDASIRKQQAAKSAYQYTRMES